MIKRRYSLFRISTPAILFLLFFIFGYRASAQQGLLGAKTIASSGTIVNEYTTLAADAAVGATTISVAGNSLNANGRFTNTLQPGELLMIIQMQGATISSANPSTDPNWGSITAYNNAGNFEFVQVSTVNIDGIHITLSTGLTKAYTASGNVQVVRVPRYTTLTINSGASITTSAWNGSIGGVVAIEASGNTTISSGGSIDVSGLGFRGGLDNNTANTTAVTAYATTTIGDGAIKGEGIAGDTTTYDALGGRYGRGAPANGGGGGNAHNCGGGGGSNGNNGVAYNGLGNPDTLALTGGGTAADYKLAWNLDLSSSPTLFSRNASSGGGRGGYSYNRDNADPTTTAPGNSGWGNHTYDIRTNAGGYGGRPLDNNSGARIFIGGGGGAGNANNKDGGGGGSGGGIVYLLSGGTLSGTGSINANGADGVSSTAQDAAGGAGAGGTIGIYSAVTLSSTGVTLNANGGIGGSQNWGGGSSGEAEGPGGGGGGGVIAVATPAAFTINANGGLNGAVINKKAGTSLIDAEFGPNGATMGASGINTLPISPPPGDNLPITLLNFSGIEKNNIVYLSWTTASEINNDYFTLERSGDGINYSFFARVGGAGNSNTNRTYQYQDDSPLIGGNYYLLSQTDYDGKTVTFYPIYIKSSLQSGSNYIVNAGPIPFDDQIKINYYITNGGAIEVGIINITGQVVKNESLVAGEGMNSFVLNNLSYLAEGIYFLRITGADANMSLKMIKN